MGVLKHITPSSVTKAGLDDYELTSAKPQTNEIPDCTEEPYDWETSTGISLEPAAWC